MSLFFLALSSGILERLVQMSDNISKDVFHCLHNQKPTFTERIKIQANGPGLVLKIGTLITKK